MSNDLLAIQEFPMRRFQGVVAAVTGAALGNGRASAIRFAKEGALVALLDPDPQGLDEVLGEIIRLGGSALPLAVELTKEEAVVGAFGRIRNELGAVDILLNSYGKSARENASEFHESVSATWETVIRSSLFPALYCTRQVVGDMRTNRRGSIVNISSDVAYYGDQKFAEYAAAKSGLLGFTRTLARELAPFGVTVNAIPAGAIRSIAHTLLSEEIMNSIKASIPLGRVGEPEEVASLVAFLASDEARYLTGQSIPLNGGRWMG
jgi:NAD(P)-dependent dehydrogenase (short-subunit alcohol dehydrogenase family)